MSRVQEWPTEFWEFFYYAHSMSSSLSLVLFTLITCWWLEPTIIRLSSSSVTSCTNPLNKILKYLNDYMKCAVIKHSRYQHGALRLVETSEWGLKAFSGVFFFKLWMSNDIGFHFLVEINIAQEVLGCLTTLCILNERVSGFPSFFVVWLIISLSGSWSSSSTVGFVTSGKSRRQVRSCFKDKKHTQVCFSGLRHTQTGTSGATYGTLLYVRVHVCVHVRHTFSVSWLQRSTRVVYLRTSSCDLVGSALACASLLAAVHSSFLAWW